ncbi:MAG: rhomboid family intramembrane serine protease [Tatlockia sp.]
MLDSLTDSLNFIIEQTKINANLLGLILLIPWVVYGINRLVNNRLLYLGIIPRHLLGLPGIVFAPLLHGNFNHLFFNSIPLLVLSDFILVNGLPYFLVVTALITFISGILIWLFGKKGIHIGASALVTGYWGLLVSDIYQQGTLTAVILGVLSLYYFMGIFAGIFPGKKGVSWEGHLFGLVAGFATSALLRTLQTL